MTNHFEFSQENLKIGLASVLIAFTLFGGIYTVYAVGQTLTVTILSTLTFTVSTNNFGSLTPGTPLFATTTLSVTTNNAPGWNVTFSGDEVTDTVQTCDLDTDTTVEITDKDPQWIPAAATTTAGNAVTITSGDDVLGFRVMTASGSVPFRASTWWGGTDGYPGSSLWAGVASSTVARRIGNAGAGSYQAAAHLNTVIYYLDVPTTQQTGAYSCLLTYTATANP